MFIEYNGNELWVEIAEDQTGTKVFEVWGLDIGPIDVWPTGYAQEYMSDKVVELPTGLLGALLAG